MIKANLTKEMFPDPNLRGLTIHPVCRDIEVLTWNILLNHLQQGKRLEQSNVRTIGYQDKKFRKNKIFRLTNSFDQGVCVQGETPGIVTWEFQAGHYMMRGLLGINSRLDKSRMLQSVESRENIQIGVKKEVTKSIEATSDYWFVQLLMTLLKNTGVQLSGREKQQLQANIEWFYENYSHLV